MSSKQQHRWDSKTGRADTTGSSAVYIRHIRSIHACAAMQRCTEATIDERHHDDRMHSGVMVVYTQQHASMEEVSNSLIPMAEWAQLTQRESEDAR